MSKPKTLPHHTSEWKGYTIDELRYMRAYTAARIEINRDRLVSKAADIKKKGIVGNSGGSMIGRMIGALGYFDMALLSWRVASRVFRTIRILRGRK